VAWIGRAADVPAVGAGKTWNIGGKVLTPCLVDQHTHIDYGAKRLVDFEMLFGRRLAWGSRGLPHQGAMGELRATA